MQPSAPDLPSTPTAALLRGFTFDEPPPADAPSPARDGGPDDGPLLAREGFRVGTLRLAIRYADGHALMEAPPVHALPCAPAWLRGMANLHGALVPVFDAAALFGLTPDGRAMRMLLVLGHGDDRAGLLIDGLPVRLKLARSDRVADAAVPPLLAGCARDAYWGDGEHWIDLDVAALLDRLEELIGALR